MSSNKAQGVEYWQNRAQKDTKMDWSKDSKSWIEDYVKSKLHPHRLRIIKELKTLKFNSILEVGCSVGSNIQLIRESFKHLDDFSIYGIDANKDSIKKAKEILPFCSFFVEDITDNPIFPVVDLVLLDAVLMYVDPVRIRRVIECVTVSAFKYVVIVDWHDRSINGVVRDFHWARNYETLLKKEGFKVKKKKLTKKDWPTKTWEKRGYIYIARRV